MKPLQAHPDFKHLAYQAAIYTEVLNLVLERFVGNELKPEASLVCELLSSKDAVVPLDEFLHFMATLRSHKNVLDQELSSFEVIRRGNVLKDQEHAVLRPKKHEEVISTKKKKKRKPLCDTPRKQE